MSSKAQKKAVKKRLKDLKNRSKGGEFFFIKEGTLRVRPLPVGEEEPGIEAMFFYLGGDIKGVVSPATFGEPCAIMDMYNELKNSDDDDDKELAGTFRPKKRFFMPVIKFTDSKGKKIDKEAGVKLVQLTNDLYQEILELWLDEDEAGDFTDPKNGYDLKLIRSGTTQYDTTYSVRACKPTKLDKKYRKDLSPEEMLRKAMPTFEQTEDNINTFLNLDADSGKKGKKDKKGKKKKKNKDI